PLPPPTATTLDEVSRHEAVRLFAARARAADPAFALDEANAEAVAAICRRLDGLPLAIELAAARVALLPPAQLAPRLHRALDLLTGGARDLPVRQQTLRATLEWSHQLLDERERELFAALAVFSGGFTVERAAAVAGATVDGLEALASMSLLVRVPPRLAML